MPRTSWLIEKNVNGSWINDGTIYAPNDSMNLDTTANMSENQLADGSKAFLTPEVKYLDDPISMTWLGLDYSDGIITKLRNYVKNLDYLRITDSKGETYIGKFTNIRRVWLSGIDDTIDIETTFKIIPVA